MNLSLKHKKIFSIASVVLVGSLAAGGFLFASLRIVGIGFPLDDAWIHQTYARNLEGLGEWAFIPGEVSGGSTAPLWTILLALGRLFGGETPYAWTYLLGVVGLVGTALIAQNILDDTVGTTRLPWVGLFLAGEWHLVWAAVSGMETIFIGCMYLFCFWALTRSTRRWEWIGLLIGLAVWVRPDGLMLIGPALFVLLFTESNWKKRCYSLIRLFAGILILFVPYLLFNHWITGSLWPNTLFAKQAEYAALREQPLLLRLMAQLILPLTGPGVFLLPGFFYVCWLGVRKRDWVVLAAVLWFLGYAGIYALRLPAIYQHGRYLMPAMPVFFWLGLTGTLGWMRKLATSRLNFILSKVFSTSMVAVWVAFIWVGAGAYARDVAIIETEMVAASRWTAKNIPAEWLVAAHDIGAMGYFGGHRLVDLAGLISPEVIPFIRDEEKIQQYLNQRQVNVLVTFPGWYPQLVQGKELLYNTGGMFAPGAGGENMAIYRWR